MDSVFNICFIILVCVLLYGRVQGAQWSSSSLPDGQMLYDCAEDTVNFAWQYALTSEEVVGDVQWLYDGQSQEMVAISSRGNFLPTPTFSQRVSRLDNAGLTVSRVLVPDAGNYSVEVNVYGQAGAVHTVLRRTAVLHVNDRLMTTDGVLHVTQLRDPVYDSVSNQWVLQLQCGNFIFKDNPPFHMEWTTPSGNVHNSTSFSNGNFYLSIPMPIESGSYTCRIPAHLSARACLRSNDTNEGWASVTVESVEARLLLLEKENSDLRNRLANANGELSATRADVADLTSRLTALQTSQNQELQQLNSQLSTTATSLQERIGKLEDAQRNQVAFHATGLSNTSPGASAPLLFNHVNYNQGNAYNRATGYFTAPYSGLYFFIAKTSTSSENTDEEHDLMVENRVIDEGMSNDPFGVGHAFPSPVHGVIHLTQGQRVYVKCRANEHLSSSQSSFTGFLLSRDP